VDNCRPWDLKAVFWGQAPAAESSLR